MNLLERVLTLLRANITSVVEKADDPEKALRQLQLDMRNQLVQVKTQVATAIAEGHKLQKRSEERSAEADLWLKKAEHAVRQGNDDTARSALQRYNDATKQVERYQQQKKEQEQLVVTMRGALRKLEAKLTEVDTTIDLLVTRKRNALLQQRVYDALNASQNPKAQTGKAQDALLEAEARARALADLQKNDLEAELEQLSTEGRVEHQLREMKAKQQARHTSPLPSDQHARGASQPTAEAQANQTTPKRERSRREGQQDVPEPQTLRDINLEELKKLLNAPE